MIKGINRQMIEVTHTGSPYFERAFLVVRADMDTPSDTAMSRMAHKIVQQADTYAGLRRRRARLWGQRIAWSAVCVGGGAGLMWLLLALGG